MEEEVEVAEGSARPNFLMFMVIMIDMYGIWHMAYVCVLLRIKKTGYSEPVLLLLVPGPNNVERRRRGFAPPASHTQTGEKKNMSESKTVVMSSSGSGSVSVSLSVTYIYICIYIGA